MGGKYKKQWACVTLFSLITAALCGACGNVMTGASGNVPETEAAGQVQPDGDLPAWQTYADDPVTLDWYINYSWFSTAVGRESGVADDHGGDGRGYSFYHAARK